MSTIRSRFPSGYFSGETPAFPGRFVWPVTVFVLLVLSWELTVSIRDIPRYLLPPPSVIIYTAWANYSTLLSELQITLFAFSIAFGLTVVTGYLMALAMFHWKVLEATTYPYVITARAVPIIALIPLFIVWFGFGFKSIVLISYLISFFAMVVNTHAGFKATDEELVEMLQSFSANQWEVFRHVYWYSALPMVFAGVKISVILTFTGVIVGEFLIGTAGIGYLILQYNNVLATPEMFAGIAIVTVTQLFLFGSVAWLERIVVTWG